MKYQSMVKEADLLKEEIQSYRPLSAGILKQLKEYYRISFTYTSNVIEGNTLTEMETKVVLEDGLTIGGKPIKDHLEALGHSDAIDLLYELATKKTMMENDILDLHNFFYHRIDLKNAGKYRDEQIIVTGSKFEFPRPNQIKELMQNFCREIPLLKEKIHPIEFAALLHSKLVTIHPFRDGNGRTARLLMNLSLLQSGYPITIIPPITRVDYLNAVEKTHYGDNQAFNNFISCMVWEAEKDYLRLIKQFFPDTDIANGINR